MQWLLYAPLNVTFKECALWPKNAFISYDAHYTFIRNFKICYITGYTEENTRKSESTISLFIINRMNFTRESLLSKTRLLMVYAETTSVQF